MSTLLSRRIRLGCIALFLLNVCMAWTSSGKLSAQIIDTGIQRAVGGVSIDASGLLDNAKIDALGQLAKLRAAAIGKAPQELAAFTEMRKVSLRGLDEAIAEAAKNKKPLPDEVKYLAGLQQVRYVFVYPEEKDIVIAGPGEGWKVDGNGNVVGVSTGRPVLQLDDLLTALRSAMQASQGGITCSIDPNPEGVARLNKLDPRADLKAQEEAMGAQNITVTGVPAGSHFARILVAADFRMKRLGMGFEAAPKGVKLPSYLSMTGAPGTPRWWMEPKLSAILKDASGMAWELQDSSVQTLTQEDVFSAQGDRQHTEKANVPAKRWAEMMTKEFSKLAVAEPVFGEMKNCMDLAVAAAVIVKERLPEKAANSLPSLFTDETVKTEVFYAPKQVASQAIAVKKGRSTLVSVSGGVAINSWNIVADKTTANDAVAEVRTKAAPKSRTGWWWN
jgi:hypothetical protein